MSEIQARLGTYRHIGPTSNNPKIATLLITAESSADTSSSASA